MGWIANEWAKKTKAMSDIKGVNVVKNKDCSECSKSCGLFILASKKGGKK